MQALGLDVGHEVLGKDGAVGWFYASDYKWNGYGPGRGSRRESRFDHVLHQIRHPLKAIASTTWMHQPQYRFIDKSLGGGLTDPQENMVQCAAEYWLRWNKMAEAVSEWSYRIEDIKNGSEQAQKLMAYAGVDDVYGEWPSVSTTTNHKRTNKPFTLDMVDQELADQIVAYGERFGYEFD